MVQKLVHYKEKHRSWTDGNNEMGIEVNADKTKYLVMSIDQNAGGNHNIKIDIISFESWNSSNIWEHI